MAEKTRNSIETIFSGAALLLAGFVLGGILTLSTQIVIARLFNPELYGVFSQAFALINALVMVTIIGMNAGSSRFISYYFEKDAEKADRVVPSSLIIIIPFSITIFGLLYLFADPIAVEIFNDMRTAEVLRVFSIIGPAMAFNSIIISGFRGYQRSKERVILLDFVIPVIQILGVSLLALLGYELFGAAVGYASAFLVTSFIAGVWYWKDYPIKYDLSITAELFRFSWPIMLSSVAVQIFLWSPPLLVGVLSTSQDVGFLNAALPIGAATKMFLSSVAFLFMPVIAEHYSRGEIRDIRSLHSTSTRWILNFTIPLLAFLFFFSQDVIGLLFGSEYTRAGLALSIMALGYIVNSGSGPIGDLLIAVGRIKKEMSANIFKLMLFLLLAFLTIPIYGFLGGAASFAIAMIAGNIARLWFGRDYIDFSYLREALKPSIATAVGLIATWVIEVLYGNAILSITVFGSVYLPIFLLTDPLTSQDAKMIRDFISRAGLEETRIKAVVEKITGQDPAK